MQLSRERRRQLVVSVELLHCIVQQLPLQEREQRAVQYEFDTRASVRCCHAANSGVARAEVCYLRS